MKTFLKNHWFLSIVMAVVILGAYPSYAYIQYIKQPVKGIFLSVNPNVKEYIFRGRTQYQHSALFEFKEYDKLYVDIKKHNYDKAKPGDVFVFERRNLNIIPHGKFYLLLSVLCLSLLIVIPISFLCSRYSLKNFKPRSYQKDI